MKVSFEGFGIYLESVSMEDSESIAAEANDSGIADSIAELGSFPNPYMINDAVSFVQNALKASMDGIEFHFAVKRQNDGKLVGVCGIKNIDNVSRKAEIGYWIGRKYWGNGYAKQAARLLLEIAFVRLDLERAYASTFAYNERSIGVLISIGMALEGTLRSNSMSAVEGSARLVDDKVFGILKSEYSHIGARFEQ